ncbi:MAG: helix-turn-helix transcriptional regulator [Aequorivita sp.]
MTNIIGTKIRKLRENLGISQNAMAYELDITQSNYGRLEKDDDRLNVPKLKKIAEVLQTSIAYLFEEKNAESIDQNKTVSSNKTETFKYEVKDHITSLKEEITFLRNFIKNKD